MKQFFWIFILIGTFANAQSFTGLQLVDITSEKLDFNVISQIFLTTNSDTIIKWSVSEDKSKYTKQISNRFEEYEDFGDSLVYKIIDFNHNGWIRQERITRDKMSKVISHEIVDRQQYHLKRFSEESSYEYFNIPAKKYWLKKWKFKAGETLETSTNETGVLYHENKMNLEEFIEHSNNEFYHDRERRFYNPCNLCVFLDKACEPIERTLTKNEVTIEDENLLLLESYFFTSKKGRLEDVYRINARNAFGACLNKFFEARGNSILWIKYIDGDVQQIPVDLIIPVEVNTFYK